ncbi:MAG TPA: GNAT family N-acetyltransferase, partial [Puia sp.]|nr:GNAT family N-acetyltransferase [Puia sp.]
DPLIWEQHPEKNRFQREVFEIFFKEAIDSGGAFAVINKKTGEIIGSTRFSRVKETQNAIEIGWTFLARRFWGGAYNKSMKVLLMDYAFNFVGNIVFCIDENNIRSRRAVEKLGGERITELEDKILETRKKTTVIYKINRKIFVR